MNDLLVCLTDNAPYRSISYMTGDIVQYLKNCDDISPASLEWLVAKNRQHMF